MSTNPPPYPPYPPQSDEGGAEPPNFAQQPPQRPYMDPPSLVDESNTPGSGQPPQFGTPAYQYPGPPQGPGKTTASTVGLVLGIIGVVSALAPVIGAPLAIPLGIVALILGILGIRKKHGPKAIASTILGGVAIIVAIVMFAAVYPALRSTVEAGVIAASANNASTQAENSAAANPASEGIDEENTDEVLNNYLSVSFGTFSASDDGYTTSLPVTIKNISSQKLSLSLTIAATGKDGSQVDTDSISVDDLEPGQSTSQTVFSFVDPSKVEPLKAATFKVSSASIYS